MSSFIPQGAWARRLAHEPFYAWLRDEFIADSSPTFAEGEGRFQRLARLGGLAVDPIRDVSEGARRSLSERSAQLTRAVAWAPPFLRRRVGEMVALEGSERYRRWQAGEQCLAMAVLRQQAVDG